MNGNGLGTGTGGILITPPTLPTDAYSVSFWYKSHLISNGFSASSSATMASNEGFFNQTGSLYYNRQSINDLQVYAYLNAPSNFATPRRLRFRNFYFPKGDMRWHMRTLVFYVVGGFAKCDEYEDGIKLGATHTVDYTGDTSTPIGQMSIGSSSTTLALGAFNGKMDEVRFHNYALSSTEVSNLYFNNIVPRTGLVGEWLFNEGSGTTALDTSGNGNNGTITGATYTTDVPFIPRVASTNKTAVQDIKATSIGSALTPVGSIDNVTSLGGSMIGIGKVTSYGGQTIASFYAADGVTGCWRFTCEATTGYPFIWTTNTSSSGTVNPKVSRPLPINKWFKYACTQSISGGNVIGNIYINGSLWGTQTQARDVRACSRFTQINVGTVQHGPVAVYERVLTAQEILDYNNTGIFPSGGKIVLQGQEGAGNIKYDSSGNGSNGTSGTLTWSSDTPTKARNQIGGNLVKNGDLSYVPVVNVAQTTVGNYIDGTSTGSASNNLFRWGLVSITGTGSTLFDTSTKYNNLPSIKVSTSTITSAIQISNYAVNVPAQAILNGYPVLPSTSYTCTVAIKTNYISGDSNDGANLQVRERSATGGTIGTPSSTATTKIKTTTDWTVYSIVFTTNALTRLINIDMLVTGNTGTGTLIMDAWFANITLTPTVNTTRASI